MKLIVPVRRHLSTSFNLLAMIFIQCCVPMHTASVRLSITSRMLKRTFPHTTRLHSTVSKEQYQWVDSAGALHSNIAPKEQGSLKIVTYNILGALHGEGQKHAYAPAIVTQWTSRREKLVEELKTMNADVFCLQEVTDRGLRETFMPALKEVGMDCVGYAPMRQPGLTSPRSRNFGGDSSQNQDLVANHMSMGCAVFSRPDAVQIMSSKRVFLKDFAPLQRSRSLPFSTDMKSKLNTMVMILVKIAGTNKTAIIANAHLHWDPARVDIKTTQTFAAMEAISRFAEVCGYTKDNTPAVILCGDFNGMPYRVPSNGWAAEEGDNPTGMFELLSTGALSHIHPEHPDQWHTKVRSLMLCPRIGAFETSLRLQNVYQLPEFAHYAPLFTTKTDDFQGWIDHIWVSSQVQVTRALVPPVYRGDVRSSARNKAFAPIPDEKHASDHLPIGIVAKIK